jgi:uncharacterized integral membrane protein
MTEEPRDPFRSEPESPPEAAPERPEVARPATTGIAWGGILLVLGIAAVVIFSVQNTDPVPVRFLWTEGSYPLAIVILVTVGVMIVLTELIGLSYRRTRRRRLAERQELKKYRGA